MNGGNHIPDPGRRRLPAARLCLSSCLLLNLYSLRTGQETSLAMARLFRFYTDTTIRTYEPPRRSGLPSIWKTVRRLGGAMANAMAPVTKANAMRQPRLDDETALSGNIPPIGEDMGWFSSFFLSLNHQS